DIGPVGVAVGDLNGDGAPDVVAADVTTSQVSVLLNLNDWGPPAPPGTHSNLPDLGKPLGSEPSSVGQPASSAANSGRHTDVLFSMARVQEDVLKEGKPIRSIRTAAQSTDHVGLEASFLRDDGMTGILR
ncbi:MAG TPA: hypothetical protein VKU02_09995, partial [Gemmataceae bacterium]|nr:hypothetical protein [Gemmataceae bacterium]